MFSDEDVDWCRRLALDSAMTTQPGLQQQFFEMLMESQRWKPEVLREYQRGQLSQLIKHAIRQVPFYETRLNVVIGSDGEIDWDRWGDIPILTRKDITEKGDDLLARAVPTAHGGRTMPPLIA
jgi:phenylacetate-coenzyme A ligase PaaK-like adenylate-forming protein